MAKISRIENPKADWTRVLNAARRTWGKNPLNKEPSNKFKREILLAEHSPIRLLEYDFTIEDIRQWVSVHLVRHHIGCEKFVHTQRQDINAEIEKKTSLLIEALGELDMLREGWKERDYLFQGESNEMDMSCNGQSFINISRRRLCKGCTSKETREVWEMVISFLKEVDPILAEKCVPECLYRGFCPEFKRCCGYVYSDKFQRELVYYRNNEEEQWKEIYGKKGYYISSLGKVRYNEEYLPIVSKNDEECVNINGVFHLVSVLVAEAFINNENENTKVYHRDGNKFNNSVNNLYWFD
jgi:hypothetical protein